MIWKGITLLHVPLEKKRNIYMDYTSARNLETIMI